jgi:ketosteroid isomerase-like protein
VPFGPLASTHANAAFITKFYHAFATRDWATMCAYVRRTTPRFRDPVFHDLDAEHVRAMWKMFCTRSADLEVEFSHVAANDRFAVGHWDARYTFSKTGRRVLNRIDATFEMRDGRIFAHVDVFSFHQWSAQALGGFGKLAGWSSTLNGAVSSSAHAALKEFMQKDKEAISTISRRLLPLLPPLRPLWRLRCARRASLVRLCRALSQRVGRSRLGARRLLVGARLGWRRAQCRGRCGVAHHAANCWRRAHAAGLSARQTRGASRTSSIEYDDAGRYDDVWLRVGADCHCSSIAPCCHGARGRGRRQRQRSAARLSGLRRFRSPTTRQRDRPPMSWRPMRRLQARAGAGLRRALTN